MAGKEHRIQLRNYAGKTLPGAFALCTNIIVERRRGIDRFRAHLERLALRTPPVRPRRRARPSSERACGPDALRSLLFFRILGWLESHQGIPFACLRQTPTLEFMTHEMHSRRNAVWGIGTHRIRCACIGRKRIDRSRGISYLRAEHQRLRAVLGR